MTSSTSTFSTFATRLVQAWYAPRLEATTALLVPLAPVFTAAAALRRALYARRVLESERLPVPVIVVGNITVGGTGKTPLVIALARALREDGRRPGIVSRGHGAADNGSARVVDAAASAASVGDEPLLIARAGFPVAIGRARAAAGRALLAAHPECDVVIADDGLQHYALARDVEIAVIDALRGLGNGWRLPAGPLREAKSRLASVDAVVVNGASNPLPFALPPHVPVFAMRLAGDVLHAVADAQVTLRADALQGLQVHAVAGIGDPDRFFAHLRALGLDPVVHAFPDHHPFVASDLALPQAQAILMTEKDAVKCSGIADARCWFLPVHAELDAALVDLLRSKLDAGVRQRTDALPAAAH